ncbi:MAG TPA: DUF58 domain-containing protein [Acetobacteraceae bacterium]|jgi:uncharacterized protein (DUF58 family)|nr:DUF58 domain-containing protein [Acetobacteraceae bacterium]
MTGIGARRAEALGARLPPLLVAAERVAATVAQGVHGRRRVGQGDSFWQFRPFVVGDAVARIDWRQSAKSGRPAPHGWFVRETEWEAAQTVALWRDGSPSMRWHSRLVDVEKRARAELLLLALAALLLRGGERVTLMAPGARPVSGRAGLDRLAADLDGVMDNGQAGDGSGVPPRMKLPRHATVVLIGDFLAPLPEIQATIGALRSVPVTGSLLQVLDPAELELPYSGRIRFRGLERDGETLIPRVENVRHAYAARLKAQQEGLAAICAAAGFNFATHRTDASPEAALLGLYSSLAGR